MDTSMETIPAGEFKAKCLGLIEEVHDTGRPVLVTKRGVPVVMVIPYEPIEIPKQKLFGIMKDSITIADDILAPINEKWEVDE